MQSVTRCHKGSGHGLNDFRLKGLMGKIGSDRHETLFPVGASAWAKLGALRGLFRRPQLRDALGSDQSSSRKDDQFAHVTRIRYIKAEDRIVEEKGREEGCCNRAEHRQDATIDHRHKRSGEEIEKDKMMLVLSVIEIIKNCRDYQYDR